MNNNWPGHDPLTTMVCPCCHKRRVMRYFEGRWDCWGCGQHGLELKIEIISRWKNIKQEK